MTDIDAYSHPERYIEFQVRRPDYLGAISTAMYLARVLTRWKRDIVLADFCCGIGSNTRLFAESVNGIEKATLLDINSLFLKQARRSGIRSRNLDIVCGDVLDANLRREYDLVFSIFAYHHLPDDKKEIYLRKAKECLKKEGVLVVAEIYLDNKELCLEYYKKLFNAIPPEKRIPGLEEFLQQTAGSSDFEFKVSKEFAEKQFRDAGLEKIAEDKIWPISGEMNDDLGTYVQAFR